MSYCYTFKMCLYLAVRGSWSCICPDSNCTLYLRNSFWVLVTSFSHSNFLLSSSNHNPIHTLVVLFYIYRNYSLEPSQQCRFFQCAIASRTPNPLLRRTGVSLLVWVITFDLSGNGGPTRSYATAGIALRII